MIECRFNKKIGEFYLDCALEVDKGEILVVLGPSGCGKTTLLDLISGKMRPDSGKLIIHNEIIFDDSRSIDKPVQMRRIGYIQQDSTLFPHMTVKENILYSVPKREWNKVSEKYKGLLELLELGDRENVSARSLSGGEKQRVAIGRALMMSPGLLLWDEPFSALDHVIRSAMQELVLEVKRETAAPMIFVTHDLNEAKTLADKLAVMEEGRILQIGSRQALTNDPVGSRVEEILGLKKVRSLKQAADVSLKECTYD